MYKIRFFIITIISFIISYSFSQQPINLEKELPIDPKVKIGKLDNGLVYYIHKNSKPEKRVELRLVVKAGSMQETDEQVGLAHFAEHMAFNGSKHFKRMT